MKYSNIHLIYFSPTHTSAKIVYAIAEGMGATSMSESDVTCESLDMEEYIDDELTIIAAPVYGGRVAETAMERFRMFRSAHHAPVVPVVLYGNRDYEDALKELCDLVSEQGFVPVAAGAFIGEHSFSRKGNPYDNACIESFHSVLKKEEIYLHTYQDSKEARRAIFEYIESWYNRKRIHSTIDYITPQQEEELK